MNGAFVNRWAHTQRGNSWLGGRNSSGVVFSNRPGISGSRTVMDSVRFVRRSP